MSTHAFCTATWDLQRALIAKLTTIISPLCVLLTDSLSHMSHVSAMYKCAIRTRMHLLDYILGCLERLECLGVCVGVSRVCKSVLAFVCMCMHADCLYVHTVLAVD